MANPLLAQNQTSTSIDQIKSFYESGLRRNGIVGSSLMLVRNGKLVFDDNDGRQSDTQPVDDNTTYHWASQGLRSCNCGIVG